MSLHYLVKHELPKIELNSPCYKKNQADTFVTKLWRRGWISVFLSVFITPKSAQVNFYGVKMTSERLFNSFILPKNFYRPTPKANFWLRPCLSRGVFTKSATNDYHYGTDNKITFLWYFRYFDIFENIMIFQTPLPASATPLQCWLPAHQCSQ